MHVKYLKDLHVEQQDARVTTPESVRCVQRACWWISSNDGNRQGKMSGFSTCVESGQAYRAERHPV